MVGCVLSQLKPSELYILSFEKRSRPLASAPFKAKNVEFLGLYPIRNTIDVTQNDSCSLWAQEFSFLIVRLDGCQH